MTGFSFTKTWCTTQTTKNCENKYYNNIMTTPWPDILAPDALKTSSLSNTIGPQSKKTLKDIYKDVISARKPKSSPQLEEPLFTQMKFPKPLGNHLCGYNRSTSQITRKECHLGSGGLILNDLTIPDFYWHHCQGSHLYILGSYLQTLWHSP